MSADIKTVDSLTLALPIRQIGNERRAIESKLNNLISRYVPEIDGVLIKWTDLNILHDKGMIIDEQPYVFWKVSFIAQVFKPIEGKLIKGKVHRLHNNYFIAKAMNSFTIVVSIPEALLESKAVQSLMVEQDIYFKIKGASRGTYRGTIDEECLELLDGLIKQAEDKDVYEYAKDFEY